MPAASDCRNVGKSNEVTKGKKNSADNNLRLVIFSCLQEDKQLHISSEEEISMSACIWANIFFGVSIMLSATPLITASI